MCDVLVCYAYVCDVYMYVYVYMCGVHMWYACVYIVCLVATHVYSSNPAIL